MARASIGASWIGSTPTVRMKSESSISFMDMATRPSSFETAFFTLNEERAGFLMEFGPTSQIFTNPRQKITEDYITGRFG